MNQGKSWKDMNSSRERANIQMPCRETFVTSTPEMFAPSGSDCTSVLPYYFLNITKLMGGKAEALRQRNLRLKPVLSFTVGRRNMHMHARLLPREEEKPITSFPINGRGHQFTAISPRASKFTAAYRE